MKAVITVIGQDKIGIIHQVTSVLTEYDVNILDINQTIMQDVFTMMMVVDTEQCAQPFDTLSAALADYGQNRGLSVRIQREDIFNAMHKI